MTTLTVDDADVQGIVRFGYRRMTEATYALARIKNVEAARAWLRSAPITSAITRSPPPPTAMQIAFTAAGLEALGTPPAVLAAFSKEFLAGMTEEHRARRLGDVGVNDPWQWEWGGPGNVPHVVVMFFAEPGGIGQLVRNTTAGIWNEAFTLQRVLGTADLDGVEPFGFADGVSQPVVDWAQERNVPASVGDYSNVVALGEFLLGYRNEYGKYTERPLIDSDTSSAGLLPAEDAPDKKDLGRNGTYLVMRQLSQDVRLFWRFIADEADGDPVEAEKLAAAFVGRTRAGDPLVPSQPGAIAGVGPKPDDIRQNQFTFDGDPAGERCPVGAHVRRANPRNADFFGHPTGVLKKLIASLGLDRTSYRDDVMSSVRFHRILRRGREYGPTLSPAEALQPAPPGEPERGLHFLCFNANIVRQFEFLQNAWMASTKFAGLTGESDPLLGNRAAIPGCPVTDSVIVPRPGGLRRRVSGVPQFVTVRGGAYFFLPSLRALRYFAGL